MPRIPLFPLPNMSSEQQAVHDAIVNGPRGRIIGPLRAALHNAELADKWQQLGELLRFRTSLSPRLSELAITITARHWDSDFEWQAHAAIAEKAGVSRAVIDAICRGERPAFEHDDERIVFEYVDELFKQHVVSDAVYANALQLLQAAGVVELTALIGYYSMVALTLNAHEFPLAPDKPRLPPLPCLTAEK